MLRISLSSISASCFNFLLYLTVAAHKARKSSCKEKYTFSRPFSHLSAFHHMLENVSQKWILDFRDRKEISVTRRSIKMCVVVFFWSSVQTWCTSLLCFLPLFVQAKRAEHFLDLPLELSKIELLPCILFVFMFLFALESLQNINAMALKDIVF